MATETKKHECPASGCEYSGTEKSVAAHYSGTRKQPDHEGGYETARQRMGTGEAKNDSKGDTDDSSRDTGSSNDDTSTEQDTKNTNSEHPTFGDASSSSSTGTSGEGDSGETEEVDLPCGCETFQPSNAPNSKGYVTCDTCGKTFQYEL